RLTQTFRDKPITPRTVRKEFNFLNQVFERAREDFGHRGLINPFRGQHIEGSKFKRKRRLKEGEYEKLIEAWKGCHGLNKFYLPLAINLAIDTGMRRQEIFNLRWTDIDMTHIEIVIRKSKTDHMKATPGRRIALPAGPEQYLLHLAYVLMDLGIFTTASKIFPMSGGAFYQAFSEAVERAELEDDPLYPGLTIRDLRH